MPCRTWAGECTRVNQGEEIGAGKAEVKAFIGVSLGEVRQNKQLSTGQFEYYPQALGYMDGP